MWKNWYRPDWHDDDTNFRLGRTADGFRWQRSRGPDDAVPILLRDGRERYDRPCDCTEARDTCAKMFASLAGVNLQNTGIQKRGVNCAKRRLETYRDGLDESVS